MAAKRTISTRVAFEGETEYKKTINDIAGEHKKLNNELKAAQAEFKATGDAEKMFTEKSKILNKQIEAQNKAIKTAEDALKKLKDNGVEKNSAAWVYWEKELTKAKTAMFNATAELNKLNTEFGEVSSATEQAAQSTADYTETLKSIDRGVKFGNILNGLSKVTSAVKGVISTAYNMGKALIMSQLSGGDWAREIMIEAARAGVSVEEYQARQYAQAVSGIDTNVINEGVKKTIENIGSTDEALIKLYGTYGIETRKATGEARNATEVFWETIDALKGISDETTRSIVAQKLLGDQFMEMRTLIDLGSEGYAKLLEEGKQNATITEESVNALSDMDAAAEKVKKTSETLAHNIQANLAPGFTAVADALATAIQKFNEFIDSEEGKQVFAEWNENLSSLAGTLKDADLKTAADGIATVIERIASAFQIIASAVELIKRDYDSFKLLLNPETTKENFEETKDKSLFELVTNPTRPEGLQELEEALTTDASSGVSASSSIGSIGFPFVQQTQEAVEEAEATAESGGGSAMRAFNDAMEKEGAKTENALGKAVSNAFSGVDDVFASMGRAHGAAYISALSSQMSRINSLISMRPTYFGSFSSGAQSAYASPTSATNLTASLYVGKDRVGSVFTPIINDQMGVDLQVMR